MAILVGTAGQLIKVAHGGKTDIWVAPPTELLMEAEKKYNLAPKKKLKSPPKRTSK
jgi:hypothetical protein